MPRASTADLASRLDAFATRFSVPGTLLRTLPRPAVVVAPMRGGARLGASHLGGPAHVPADFSWPRSDDGFPLTLIAQLACAAGVLPGFPDRGWLLFFATVVEGDISDAQADYCAVRWIDCPSASLRETVAPITFASGLPIPKSERDVPQKLRAVELAPFTSLPTAEDLAWVELGPPLTDEQSSAWDDLCDALPAPEIYYGGYARPLQSDPRLDAARMDRGLDDDGSEESDAEERALVEAALGWTHLFELEAESGSRCYFMVPGKDLATRTFDRARLIVQLD